MNPKIYFITGNKNKVEIFIRAMQPEYKVIWFKPPAEIQEKESFSVKDVVVDKLTQVYKKFAWRNCFLFVTDVGLYINQLRGKPGAIIKRETQKLFNGNFAGWCNILNPKKSRKAYVKMIIAAKNPQGEMIIIDHKVHGYISEKPFPGPGKFGFSWDEIFIPDPILIDNAYQNKSFAQIPEEVKLKILVYPAIKKFKQKLGR